MEYLTTLPEGCISEILSKTSPGDVCRSSATCKAVNAAAESDTVWESFLPSDYRDIIGSMTASSSLSSSSSSPSPSVFLLATKKQLFLTLSHSPILLHHGHTSIILDKESGKKCYMIGARLLTIIWSEPDYYYWSWISFPGSRFSEVAHLNSVCWLEIKGRIDTQVLSLKTSYVAYLVFKMEEDNYGFDGLQLKAWIKYVHEGLDYDGDDYSIVYLKEPAEGSLELLDGELPRNRSDGWKEIELGEFVSGDGNNVEVEMRLLATNGLYGKCGLIVQGIELRPKVVAV